MMIAILSLGIPPPVELINDIAKARKPSAIYLLSTLKNTPSKAKKPHGKPTSGV